MKVPKLHISIILFLVSVILKYLAFSISVIGTPLYYLITLKWASGTKKLSEWFYNMARSNDKTGAVQSAVTFQFLFTKKGAPKFGEDDEFVSYILARSQIKKKLNPVGWFMAKLLNLIDSKDGGHMTKAIRERRNADIDAVNRLELNEYFT